MKIIIFCLLIVFLFYNLKSKKENFATQLPIYCINLDGADKRWNRVTEQFKNLGLNLNRFPAVKKLKI